MLKNNTFMPSKHYPMNWKYNTKEKITAPRRAKNKEIMKKILSTAIIVAAVILGMVSISGCEKQEEREPEITLIISPDSLAFSSSGGEKSFTIVSNTSWTVSSNMNWMDNWLEISPTSGSNNGTVTVKAGNSTLAYERPATITVSGADITQSIKVTQQPGVPVVLTVSKDSLSFLHSGQILTFSVNSNIHDWTVKSDANWLSVNRSTVLNTVEVYASPNPSPSLRTATVTVSGGGITHSIKVTQAEGGPYLKLFGDGNFLFYIDGGQKTFTIQSSVDWTIDSNVAWLTVSPTSGSGNSTVTVTATANITGSDRTTAITVSGGGMSETINVRQLGIPLGSIMFWVSGDFLCGPISVELSGQGAKWSETITRYYPSGTPSCGAIGTATFTDLPYGTYSYTASCSRGSLWSGTVTLRSSCQSVKVY